MRNYDYYYQYLIFYYKKEIPSLYICEALKRFYQDSVDLLREIFDKLTLIVDGIACVRITDPEVKRLLVDTYDKNGDGEISESEADLVVDIVSTFSKNTTIKDLSCLKSFKNARFRYNGGFNGCTSLEVAELSDAEGWSTYQLFLNCTSLRYVRLPSNLTSLSSQCFIGCTNLKSINLPESLTQIAAGAFNNSGIEKLVIPSLVTSAGDFKDMPELVFVELGKSVSSFSINTFQGCNKLQTMIVRAITPPAWGYKMLDGINPNIYVPDESVNAYKTASGWSSKASIIYPLSTYKEE